MAFFSFFLSPQKDKFTRVPLYTPLYYNMTCVELHNDSQAQQERKSKGKTLTLTGDLHRLPVPGWVSQVFYATLSYVVLWAACYSLGQENIWTLVEFVSFGICFTATLQLCADSIWIGLCPSFFIDALPLALVMDLHSPSAFSRTVSQSHIDTTCAMTTREILNFKRIINNNNFFISQCNITQLFHTVFRTLYKLYVRNPLSWPGVSNNRKKLSPYDLCCISPAQTT